MAIPTYVADFQGGLHSSGRFLIAANSQRLGTRLFEYAIDNRALMGLATGRLEPRLLDIVDVFRSTYLFDRRAPRDAGYWPRDMTIKYPVRQPEFWQSSRVFAVLDQLLWRLTGDSWHIEFDAVADRGRAIDAQLGLALAVPSDIRNVTLLSGGIDSLYGAMVCSEPGPVGQTLAVSVFTSPHQRNVQSDIASALRFPPPFGGGRDIVHLQAKVQLSRDLQCRERTQRTRVLMFLGMGVLAAVSAGCNELTVSENGPGALNLPPGLATAGPKLNRAMHPATLRLIGELVSLALDRPFRIHNVGLGITKRQMVRALRDLELEEFVGWTVSCDRFPHTPVDRHCGRCSSCVLRAMALRDMPELLDAMRHDGARRARAAAIRPSAAWIAARMTGAMLDEVLRESRPLECMAALDPDLDDAVELLGGPTLLNMLADYRWDVAELEALVDGVGDDLAERFDEFASPTMLPLAI